MRTKCLFANLFIIFMLLFLFGSQLRAEEGLIAYWPFEQSGDLAKDESGNGNDGEIIDAKRVEGKFGKALEFDGGSSWVKVPSSGLPASLEALTISVWVYPTSFAAGWARIVDWDGQVLGLWLGTANDGSVSVWLYPGPVILDRTATKLEMENWTHLALVWEGECKVYFDGEADTVTIEKKPPLKPGKDFPLALGTNGNEAVRQPVHENYAGILDEVAIYDYAFSKEEIQEAMNGRLPGVKAAVEENDLLTTTWGEIKRSFR